MFKHIPELSRDLPREIGRDGIADLYVLLRATAVEEVVVGKRLQAGGLADRKAAALGGIGMNEVVTVFRKVTRDGGGRVVP